MSKVGTRSADAQLLVFPTPGKLVGELDGTATEDTTIPSLRNALGGGSGPSGCGP